MTWQIYHYHDKLLGRFEERIGQQCVPACRCVHVSQCSVNTFVWFALNTCVCSVLFHSGLAKCFMLLLPHIHSAALVNGLCYANLINFPEMVFFSCINALLQSNRYMRHTVWEKHSCVNWLGVHLYMCNHTCLFWLWCFITFSHFHIVLPITVFVSQMCLSMRAYWAP